MYCPGHARAKGNDRAERLEGKATTTEDLKCWGAWDPSCCHKAMGIALSRRGEKPRKWKCSTIFLDRAIVNPTNMGTISKATLGQLLWISSWTELSPPLPNSPHWSTNPTPPNTEAQSTNLPTLKHKPPNLPTLKHKPPTSPHWSTDPQPPHTEAQTPNLPTLKHRPPNLSTLKHKTPTSPHWSKRPPNLPTLKHKPPTLKHKPPTSPHWSTDPPNFPHWSTKPQPLHTEAQTPQPPHTEAQTLNLPTLKHKAPTSPHWSTNPQPPHTKAQRQRSADLLLSFFSSSCALARASSSSSSSCSFSLTSNSSSPSSSLQQKHTTCPVPASQGMGDCSFSNSGSEFWYWLNHSPLPLCNVVQLINNCKVLWERERVGWGGERDDARVEERELPFRCLLLSFLSCFKIFQHNFSPG